MPDMPAVFEMAIPLPGNRSLPVWAIGAGALIAGGLILLRRRSASTAGPSAAKVNTSGLQTNQFFEALARQSTQFQNALAQQQRTTQQQITTTATQVTALQSQLTGRVDTLSQQMQTNFTNVSAQVQQTNVNVNKLQQQVNALIARDARVQAKQAEVFQRAWAEMGGPVTAVQTAEHFPDPQIYGIGPTGIMITDQQGHTRYQDTSKFGTLVQ